MTREVAKVMLSNLIDFWEDERHKDYDELHSKMVDLLSTPAQEQGPVSWRTQLPESNDWFYLDHQPSGKVIVSEPLYIHPAPSSPAPSTTGEATAWLIERGQDAGHSPTLWWCGGDRRASIGEDEMNNWTDDAATARRFPTRLTAMKLAGDLFSKGTFTITEHVFLDDASPPASSPTLATKEEQIQAIIDECNEFNESIGAGERPQDRVRSDAETIYMHRYTGITVETIAMMLTDFKFARHPSPPQLPSDLKWVEEVRKRADAATAGPWRWSQCYELDGVQWSIVTDESEAAGSVMDGSLVLYLNLPNWFDMKPADTNPNWQFIAHARADIPKLCDTVLAQAARIEELERAAASDSDDKPIERTSGQPDTKVQENASQVE